MVVRLLLALSLALLIAADAPVAGAVTIMPDAVELVTDADGTLTETCALEHLPSPAQRRAALAAATLPPSPSLDRVFRPPRVVVAPSR